MNAAPQLASGAKFSSWPSDLRMVGYVLDPSHRKTARALIRNTPNRDAKHLLRAWRHSGFQFCIVAGHLHSADGPTIGGLAASWHAALELFRTALWRFDGLAVGAGFSSAWMLFVNDERQAQVHATVAALQQTLGHA